MRCPQLFEMVEKRGQPFYLIELKLYLISKSRAKALRLERRERSEDLTTSRPLGPPDIDIIINICIIIAFRFYIIIHICMNMHIRINMNINISSI